MPRRYYTRRYYGGRDKYSIEQRAGEIGTDSNGNGSQVIVQSTTVQGMRKVKHVTVSLGGLYQQGTASSVVYYALVFVPSGYNVNNIETAANASMYEPNQFVMTSGILTLGTGSNRISSPVARNLNSGDAIYLVIRSGAGSTTYQFMVRYAITLQ